MFEFKETISVLKLPFMDYVWMQRLSLFVCVCVCVCEGGNEIRIYNVVWKH